MPSYPRRKHSAVMREALRLARRRVADIGCGDGALVRFMTRDGAEVIGVEPGTAQLELARAAEPAGSEAYVAGAAEALPLASESRDLLVFFNSLHHVPVEHHAHALGEAARVLRCDGLLYVMEPLADGDFFEFMRPIEDETEVRAKAYEALQAAATTGVFAAIREEVYDAPVKYASFEAWKSGFVAVDPARASRVEGRMAELAEAFAVAAERRDGAFYFDQPSRLTLFKRR